MLEKFIFYETKFLDLEQIVHSMCTSLNFVKLKHQPESVDSLTLSTPLFNLVLFKYLPTCQAKAENSSFKSSFPCALLKLLYNELKIFLTCLASDLMLVIQTIKQQSRFQYPLGALNLLPSTIPSRITRKPNYIRDSYFQASVVHRQRGQCQIAKWI